MSNRLFETAVAILACICAGFSSAREVMLMNRIGPSKATLFIANADGSNERRLLPDSTSLDYDASFSVDGQWIVFTSERDSDGDGQSDLWRVHPDGSGLERMTDQPSMEDVGVLSPDGRTLAYISTRGGARTTNVWVMDLATKQSKNLTGNDRSDIPLTMNSNFRPSWSSDGQRIAFSSDRGEGWIGAEEGAGVGHSHPTSVYTMRADGSDLHRVTATAPATATGSPQWSADGSKLLVYVMPTRDTFGARMGGFGAAQFGATSQIVELDVAGGAPPRVITNGVGLKTNPHYLPGGIVGYLVKASPKDGPPAGIAYSDGSRGPSGEVRDPAWSADGKSVVYYRFESTNRAQYTRLHSWDSSREYRYTDVFPALCRKTNRLAITDLNFPFGNPTASLSVMNIDGSKRQKIFQRQDGASMLPTWSPDCQRLAVGFGVFFGGRGFAPANIFMVNADGSESKQVTTSKVNAAFPAWHPDGRTIIYRVWGKAESPETRGLRSFDLVTGETKVLTTEWDNFPFISPSGDRVVFTRRMADFDFEIFSMKPDGSDVMRLTTTRGADAHATWSADGKQIWFESSRTGFKDEGALYDTSPQPYAQIFIMNRDGSHVRQLTDSRWEDSMGMYATVK